jgi:hypothetical protein
MANLSLIAVGGMCLLALILLVLAWFVRCSARPQQHRADAPPASSVHDKVMSLHGSDLDPKLQDALAELAMGMDKKLVADRRA